MRFILLAAAVVLFKAPSAAAPPGRIALLPADSRLCGKGAIQKVAVESLSGSELAGDGPARPRFASSNPRIASVDPAGLVHAVSDGTCTISATAGGQRAAARIVVTGAGRPTAWSFTNQVLPILTRNGCNAGACHGAAAGKGGLKMSLRGFDPNSDYNVLVKQALGRRVAPGDPESSLLLLKPSMSVPHGGGLRIARQSPDWQIIAGWIRAGAVGPRTSDPKLLAVHVLPEHVRTRPGAGQQFLVRADYSDGRTADVTRWAKFGSSNNSVAVVDDDGHAKVMASGEAAVTVWFSSRVTYARVTAPYPGIAPQASTASNGFIDQMINRKLVDLNLPVSPKCTDLEFVRRITLDMAGVLPTPQEAEMFERDRNPDKRARLAMALMARPEFVDYWTYKWSDLLLVSTKKIPANAMQAYYGWIHKSVAENKPWNRFAQEIITARGSNLQNGAANYYVLHKDPIDLTETTTQAFMGLSLTCARCHNHPMEKWTQRDYYQMANLVSRVRLKNGDTAGEVLVLGAAQGDINHPRLGYPLPPRPLDGVELAIDGPADRRQALADWLTSPSNPYFARALVNRVWHNFFGKGLVEAEDDLRVTNPPTNPALLDRTAEEFVKHNYDVKWLIGQIVTSDAYSRSSTPVGANMHDDRFYSHYIVRRLPSEVLLDAVSQVTGIPSEFMGYPKGTRALQLPDTQVASYFLTAFGRPEREKTCACERTDATNVAQALHLANGDTINNKLRAPGGVIDRLAASKAPYGECLDTLSLAALSRPLTAQERAKALAAIGPAPATAMGDASRRAVIEDLAWALLTDREFIFNH